MIGQPVIIVDVSNLVFRCGYGFPNLSCNGQKTGALYGVLKTILELRRKVSPRLVFAWDHGVPVPGAVKPANWRDEAVPKYKANRIHDAESEAIVAQMPMVYKALKLLGYCSVSIMGLEADDIIGILTEQMRQVLDVLIFSTDIDFYQLLGKRVRVLYPKQEGGEYLIVTANEVEQKYDVRIDRWAEFLALGGDKSDNIKVKGMGPVTAARLINAGANLDKPLHRQPVDKFLTRDNWKTIQQAYFAAKLPTSWRDERIAKCVLKAGGVPLFHTEQLLHDRENVHRFHRMLSDYNMLSLLEQRHDFYNNNGASACPTDQPAKATTPTHGPKPKPKTKPKSRPKMIQKPLIQLLP